MFLVNVFFSVWLLWALQRLPDSSWTLWVAGWYPWALWRLSGSAWSLQIIVKYNPNGVVPTVHRLAGIMQM